MGQYLIAGTRADDIPQVIDYVREQGALTEAQSWDWAAPGGTLFTDPDRDDAACATLYVGFTPSDAWRPALHDAIRTHAGHLRDYRDAVRAGQSPTAAQTQHVIADIIDWLRLSEDRL